jgi:hypothetical protein
LDYLRRFLLAVEARLLNGKAWCYALDDELIVVLERDGRSLYQPLHDSVYHVEPDGSDVERHASWLVELFDEDAR